MLRYKIKKIMKLSKPGFFSFPEYDTIVRRVRFTTRWVIFYGTDGTASGKGKATDG